MEEFIDKSKLLIKARNNWNVLNEVDWEVPTKCLAMTELCSW